MKDPVLWRVRVYGDSFKKVQRQNGEPGVSSPQDASCNGAVDSLLLSPKPRVGSE